ncbi:MAG: SRPBCC domain-containing protein [Bryobacterales bacterium]|nr:SRPBCC domain-containing protein [Bryobacterales bacterium]
MTPGNKVTVSVTVEADPATAFRLFTEETDLWWRRGPKFRAAGRAPGVIRFEPRLGGALIETFDHQSCVTGTITAWDPPRCFKFEWRGVNFAPGESTEVDVLFEAVPAGTRVTVHHSGWALIRPDHPVRHGLPVAAFIRNLGMWWADLLTSLREHAA